MLCVMVLALCPAAAIADEIAPAPTPANLATVIITQVQTGAATASDEFVELFNTSDTQVDITGWQVRYLNAGKAGDATSLLATVAGPGDTPVVLAAHTRYTLHTASIVLPGGVAGQTYTAGLSKTDKTVALFARDTTACQMVAQDAVAWQTAASTSTTMGEGTAVTVDSTQVNKEKLLQRQLDVNDQYIDTDNNAYDFVLASAQALQASDSLASGSVSPLPAITIPGCTVAAPEVPAATEPPATSPDDSQTGQQPPRNDGLPPPQLSEVLPNPAAPRTDAVDEYIELYNPGDAPFDLGGYRLEAGLTTKYHYTFPAGTVLNPQTFTAFYSAETKLTLANTNGQVRLLDPAGAVVALTEPYAAASDDQAWALVGDVWQWTATPTPGAANVAAAPTDARGAETPASNSDTIPATNNGLQAPQLTELLPNPASPQTDQDDEFIELYNPNDTDFDLSGYVLEVGLTTKHRYTIPDGVILSAHTYLAFLSADTGLALSNTSGQARLIDPLGAVVSQTDQYATAKDGQAWALLNDTWQWTARPTPGASNVGVVLAAAKKATTPIVAKKPKVKAASTTKTKAKPKAKATKTEQVAQKTTATTAAQRNPLHLQVLALIMVSALLYGAYEYRQDLANKFHQFRSNRAARK